MLVCRNLPSACDSSSLVAFGDRSHCIRTPGGARTCASRVMGCVCDCDRRRCLAESARRDRAWFARVPMICAGSARASGRVAAAREPTRACAAGQSMICCPVTQALGTAPIPFGGQTGRSICRGNRDSALIRKAKQPRDRVLIMPFDISPDTASPGIGTRQTRWKDCHWVAQLVADDNLHPRVATVEQCGFR